MSCPTTGVVAIDADEKLQGADGAGEKERDAPAENNPGAERPDPRTNRRPGTRLFEVLEFPEAFAHWNGA